ncbi:hypothetical protein OS493_007588 [Desmophyllum pertusum]|uniref:Uncharacterized protein n=1 Tax=Desmophyllum pertusum TaxID=174260 RepID=A0A9W9Z3T5_9CNID|nr:hypothetical protein OS493_007588 [Desmophyllum pertusum]
MAYEATKKCSRSDTPVDVSRWVTDRMYCSNSDGDDCTKHEKCGMLVKAEWCTMGEFLGKQPPDGFEPMTSAIPVGRSNTN